MNNVLLLALLVGPSLQDPFAGARSRMVREQIEARGIRDPRVLRAMRTVPRHLFVPEPARNLAYADHPLAIGHGQTISQPFMVAAMTEHLAIEPDDKVLEIGTGSGYQAAVLAELAGHVYTIEIVAPLGERAREALAEYGRENVTVRIGDGFRGWPEHAPFDAIMVTAAPEEIPPALIDQLKPGGRLVIPVGPRHGRQYLTLVDKKPDGTVRKQKVMAVRFVPFTGEAEKQ